MAMNDHHYTPGTNAPAGHDDWQFWGEAPVLTKEDLDRCNSKEHISDHGWSREIDYRTNIGPFECRRKGRHVIIASGSHERQRPVDVSGIPIAEYSFSYLTTNPCQWDNARVEVVPKWC